MSTLVTNELFAQPGRGDDVANLLLEILGESLQHDGCQTIRILRDQDDPDHVTGLTQWTERHNFEDYLAWRTERGFTGTFETMLTRPFVIHYYDITYFGEGIAGSGSPNECSAGTGSRGAAGRRGSRGCCLPSHEFWLVSATISGGRLILSDLPGEPRRQPRSAGPRKIVRHPAHCPAMPRAGTLLVRAAAGPQVANDPGRP